MTYDWKGESVRQARRKRLAISATTAVLTICCVTWAYAGSKAGNENLHAMPLTELRGTLPINEEKSSNDRATLPEASRS